MCESLVLSNSLTHKRTHTLHIMEVMNSLDLKHLKYILNLNPDFNLPLIEIPTQTVVSQRSPQV